MRKIKPATNKDARNENASVKIGTRIVWGLISVVVIGVVLLLIFFGHGGGYGMAYTLGKEIAYSVNRIVQNSYVPNRGDMVAFYPAEIACTFHGEEVPLRKRIIGLPGEVVMVRDGDVFVDGKEIFEPYASWSVFSLPERSFSKEVVCEYPEWVYQNALDNCVFECDPGTTVSWTVPADSVFVMDDDRYASVDSRAFGFVPLQYLVLKTIMTVWPIDLFERFGPQSY